MSKSEEYVKILPDEIRGFVKEQLKAGMEITRFNIESMYDGREKVSLALTYTELKKKDIMIDINVAIGFREC